MASLLWLRSLYAGNFGSWICCSCHATAFGTSAILEEAGPARSVQRAAVVAVMAYSMVTFSGASKEFVFEARADPMIVPRDWPAMLYKVLSETRRSDEDRSRE